MVLKQKETNEIALKEYRAIWKQQQLLEQMFLNLLLIIKAHSCVKQKEKLLSFVGQHFAMTQTFAGVLSCYQIK